MSTCKHCDRETKDRVCSQCQTIKNAFQASETGTSYVEALMMAVLVVFFGVLLTLIYFYHPLSEKEKIQKATVDRICLNAEVNQDEILMAKKSSDYKKCLQYQEGGLAGGTTHFCFCKHEN